MKTYTNMKRVIPVPNDVAVKCTTYKQVEIVVALFEALTRLYRSDLDLKSQFKNGYRYVGFDPKDLDEGIRLFSEGFDFTDTRVIDYTDIHLLGDMLFPPKHEEKKSISVKLNEDVTVEVTKHKVLITNAPGDYTGRSFPISIVDELQKAADPFGKNKLPPAVQCANQAEKLAAILYLAHVSKVSADSGCILQDTLNNVYIKDFPLVYTRGHEISATSMPSGHIVIPFKDIASITSKNFNNYYSSNEVINTKLGPVTVSKKNVTFGCQTFPITVVKELVEAKNKVHSTEK